VGKSYPPRSSYIDLNGVQVPMGPPVHEPASTAQHYSLLYSECIVYDFRQMRLRYLLRVQFKYHQLFPAEIRLHQGSRSQS